jgi:hypothetical protein
MMREGEFRRIDTQLFRTFSSCDGGVVAMLRVVPEQYLYVCPGYTLLFIQAVLLFLRMRMYRGCQQRKRKVFVLHAGLIAAAASAGFTVAAPAGAFPVSMYAYVEFLYLRLARTHGGVIQISPLVRFHRRAALKDAGGGQEQDCQG